MHIKSLSQAARSKEKMGVIFRNKSLYKTITYLITENS